MVPGLLTIYILYWIVSSLDRALQVPVPGLGIVLTFALTVLVGLLVSNVLGRQIAAFIDRLFARLPFVKLLYGSLHDLVGAFVGGNKTFGRPVAVRISPQSDVRLLGFLTRDQLSFFALPSHVAVYVPQAYNIGGQVLCVPREQVDEINASSAELLTFMMSGGVSGFGTQGADHASRDSSSAS